jgi:hypothetical protein
MRSTSTCSSGGSGSRNQSIKEHLGPTSTTTTSTSDDSAPSHKNDDDVHDDGVAVHRPDSGCINNDDIINDNKIYKLILPFAITFIAVHQLLVHPVLMLMTIQSSHNRHYAKKCVETETNIFQCTDYDPSRSSSSSSSSSNTNSVGAKNNSRQQQPNEEDSTRRYLGVAQYVSGSDDEMQKMQEILQSMEQYWGRWMLATVTIMKEYDEIDFANIWYVVVGVDREQWNHITLQEFH